MLYYGQSMTPQNYLHATYSGGCICESGLSVHYSHGANSMLLILHLLTVKISVLNQHTCSVSHVC